VTRLADIPPGFIRTYAVLLGLVAGSFANVVIYRVPRGLSVVRPASRCPACGVPIAPWHNIPVVSYLWLRGRARCCGARMSPRYVVVEALGGMLSLAIAEAIVLALPPDTSIGRAAAVFTADFFLAIGLLITTFIDLEHMYVPDPISIGGAILGISTFSLRPGLTFTGSIVGAAAGFLIVWIPFGVIYRKLRGRTGMALGDAKLLMLAGAWFGWVGAAFALLAGAVQGTVVILLVLLLKGKIEEPPEVLAEKEREKQRILELPEAERARAEAELARDPIHEPSSSPGSIAQARIAFGPFLALAMLEYLLLGRDFIEGYVRWIGFAF
jgi:leader peptidase (prepilin peptidase) / N-methyltransferase